MLNDSVIMTPSKADANTDVQGVVPMRWCLACGGCHGNHLHGRRHECCRASVCLRVAIPLIQLLLVLGLRPLHVSGVVGQGMVNIC